MQPRPKSIAWRSTVWLLLFTLVLTPAAGLPTQVPAATRPAAAQAPAAPGDHLVTNITLTPDTPNILAFNQRVVVAFDYSTTEPTGVRIFARPFTNGALTPNYAADGSPVYPTSATGTGTNGFTITSGTVLVDQIRIQMLDASQSTLLFETFIPVHYLFGDPVNLVTGIALTPDTPDALAFNQDVTLTFNYSTRQQGGVRIFARPFTNGALTPNYAASGSPLYPTGGGSGTGYFTITVGQVVVDQIRIQMWDANQTTSAVRSFPAGLLPLHGP